MTNTKKHPLMFIFGTYFFCYHFYRNSFLLRWIFIGSPTKDHHAKYSPKRYYCLRKSWHIIPDTLNRPTKNTLDLKRTTFSVLAYVKAKRIH